MRDSVYILRGLEELYPENRFIERLRHCVETYPALNWQDAMARGQINSKQWILHQLEALGMTRLNRVIVCGGWLGTLSRLILDSEVIHASYVESLDIDMDATIAAGELNMEYLADNTFLARLGDCYDSVYEDYDTIINTSCEHFDRFSEWWGRVPIGKLCVLQSNDFFECDEHVNCVNNEQELATQAVMQKVLYAGSMPAYKYTRFMVIGIK